MILSILIPTLVDRRDKYNILKSRLEKLSEGYEVEILSIEDNREKTTGQKRNELIDMATGRYSVFVDDDDNVPDWYFKEIFNAIDRTPDLDCIGLKGLLLWQQIGVTVGKREVFRHSVGLPFSDGMVKGEYLRPPNHINPMLTDYFRQIRFPDKTFAEDYDFCIRLAESKLIKKEVFIDAIMYHYHFNPNK